MSNMKIISMLDHAVARERQQRLDAFDQFLLDLEDEMSQINARIDQLIERIQDLEKKPKPVP